MPRDGSNIYHRPAGTDGVPNFPIESSKYNAYVADVEQDLNLPRPIVAGGTGANNATDAMTSMQGDKAYQVVTNYDSYPFISGSFYSAAGATSAPTGNAFIGICYTSDPAVVPPAVPVGANMFIEARDVTTGTVYVRQKTSSVWGAWKQDFVKSSGDTMTGALTVNGSITSNPTATTGSYFFGSSGTKSITYDGTQFNFAGGPLFVVSNNINAQGTVASALTATTGTYFFGSSGTKYLTYGGTQFNLTGGSLVLDNPVFAATTATTGTYNFGTSGTKNLTYDGSAFSLVGGSLFVNSTVVSAAGGGIGTFQFGNSGARFLSCDNTVYAFADGIGLKAGSGIQCRTGYFGAYVAGSFNISFSAGLMSLWVDGTNLGTINVTSDYRVKKDVIDLPGMWDTVKGLRPIKYTQAEYSPPSGGLFPADDAERWGFVAHELQQTLVPSAANGSKDASNEVQSLNPSAPDRSADQSLAGSDGADRGAGSKMSSVTNWLKENQALVILLVGQAIVGGIYLVNLEARVSILETRGSPHLAEINNRLTVLESITKENKDRLERVTEVMTRRLQINP